MTQRHRLNRGGDRQANRALHMIAISRLRVDERTKIYAAKKTAEGHSKLEIIRCLKRLLAREVYYLLHPDATAQQAARSQTSQLAGSSITSQPAGAQARSTSGGSQQ
jgi:hypothetical protein